MAFVGSRAWMQRKLACLVLVVMVVGVAYKLVVVEKQRILHDLAFHRHHRRVNYAYVSIEPRNELATPCYSVASRNRGKDRQYDDGIDGQW